jgi:5-methylcytosine-specific restriction endonuclease McrA
MSKTKQPFLPLFFGDLLAATPRWKGPQRSLYVLLLAYQWFDGPIPNSPNEIADMCGYPLDEFERLWAVVGRKFVPCDGGLMNVRLEEHRNKALNLSRVRSESGSEGAASKWGNGKTHGKTRSERLAEARAKGRHTDEEWEALNLICGDECRSCGSHRSQLHGNAFCKDHIIPIYEGGSDAIENIQPLCRQCNSKKAQTRTDYRPPDWRKRMAEAIAKRMANGMAKRMAPSHPIPSHPNPTQPCTENSAHKSESGMCAPGTETGTGAKTGTGSATVTELDERERHVRFQRCKAKLPKFAGRQNWIVAEHNACRIVSDGFGTWDEIEAGCERYAKFIEATGQTVMNPVNFFGAVDRPCLQDWEIPIIAGKPAQASTRGDAVIDSWLKKQD